MKRTRAAPAKGKSGGALGPNQQSITSFFKTSSSAAQTTTSTISSTSSSTAASSEPPSSESSVTPPLKHRKLDEEDGKKASTSSTLSSTTPTTLTPKKTFDDLSKEVAADAVMQSLESYDVRKHSVWRPVALEEEGVEKASAKTSSVAPYLHLARTFECISSIKGRIAILDGLTNCFRSLVALSPEEVLPAMYLCTNQIAPPFEGLELNVGESTVTGALSTVTGFKRQELKTKYNSLGDWGDVAISCKRQQSVLMVSSQKTEFLTIQTVHAAMRQLSELKGPNVNQRKQDVLLKMLRACRETEIKFIVRTLLQNLRVGANLITCLCALVRAVVIETAFNKKGDGKRDVKKLNDELLKGQVITKHCYNVCPCLDVLVPALISGGIDQMVKACQLRPGVPLMPMLARPANGLDDVLKRFNTIGSGSTSTSASSQPTLLCCEYKYDGQRAQIHMTETTEAKIRTVKIFSRHLEDITQRFPDVCDTMKKVTYSEVTSFIIDAEIVAVDHTASMSSPTTTNSSSSTTIKEEKKEEEEKVEAEKEAATKHATLPSQLEDWKILPFQKLSTRSRKEIKIEDVEVAVCVFAFDLIFLNGKSLMTQPLIKRKEKMSDVFRLFRPTSPKEAGFDFVKEMRTTIDNFESVRPFLLQSFTSSCEGLMIKLLDDNLKSREDVKVLLEQEDDQMIDAIVSKDKDKKKGREVLITSNYEPDKRTGSWTKLKKDYCNELSDTVDLVPLGAWWGNGRKAGWFSPILLGCYDPTTETYQTLCRCMSGLNDEFYKTMTAFYKEHLLVNQPYYYNSNEEPDVWFQPVQVWEIRGADLTISPVHTAASGIADRRRDDSEQHGRGISLRFPRFLRVRDDKKPEDATTSIQIADMYFSQEPID